MQRGRASTSAASVDKAVLDLAQLALHLLCAGVGVKQPEGQLRTQRPAGAFQPIRSFRTISEDLDGGSVDAFNAG